MFNSYSTTIMKKQPLISVIVASYNYAKYIKETLDSLIRQTNKSFEVIVVDDGSRDQSLPIIEEYANRFKNIKLYTHPGNQNRGLAETVKLGIEKSNGEYIAFCESMIIGPITILNIYRYNSTESFSKFHSQWYQSYKPIK